MIVKPLYLQRLCDLSMQEYGSVEHLFEVALTCGFSITHDIVAGVPLELPVIDTDALDKSISLVLKKIYNIPASADEDETVNGLMPGGIGFMNVEGNFIVS